ncbi:MAG: hypothetical protein JKY65_01080, partial [Planctomycetes bacterium]|nr:hypothetical protein [Planctomycetota bacterium]
DSLFTEKSQKNFEELQTHYETAKKEKELLTQEQEITLLKQQEHSQRLLKNLAFAAIFIALFVIFLLVNRQRLKRVASRLEGAPWKVGPAPSEGACAICRVRGLPPPDACPGETDGLAS